MGINIFHKFGRASFVLIVGITEGVKPFGNKLALGLSLCLRNLYA